MDEDEEAFITHPPPPLPYIKGRRFVVRSHNPLPPERYKTGCRKSFNDSRVEFEIVDEIRVGFDHSAQILAVKILQGPPGLTRKLGNNRTVVAKFYDPLYWDHGESTGDPFYCVNRHYTHEAATYDRLADLQGTVVPFFYGSYSLELPVDHPLAKTRSVRLIFMEHIHASSMRELKPEDFSQSERQHIIKLIIDGETAIHTRDIILEDLHPRNVLVERGQESQQDIKRVVHIDFGSNMMSRFWWEGYGAEREKTRLPGVFVSPLIRWHRESGRTFNFLEWIDWDYQSWLQDEYAHTLSSVTPQILSAYLPEVHRRYLDSKTLQMFGIEASSEN